MFVRSKKKHTTKLDDLLKAGASGQKKPDIDKALISTTHRLLKEKITFTKARKAVDSAELYRKEGFIVLDPKNENAAAIRLRKVLGSKAINKKSKGFKTMPNKKKLSSAAPNKGKKQKKNRDISIKVC